MMYSYMILYVNARGYARSLPFHGRVDKSEEAMQGSLLGTYHI